MVKLKQVWAGTSLLLLCTAATWAQHEGTQASTALPPGSQKGTDQPSPQAPNPGTQENSQETTNVPALSGAGKFSPGYSGGARSYILPSFQWTEFADTNSSGTAGRSRVTAQGTYIGSVTLQRVHKHSQLNLGYAGGVFSTSGPLQGNSGAQSSRNGMLHQLQIAQTHTWRRWQVLVVDNFLYLPESPFGYAGLSGLTSFGSGLGGAYLANPTVMNPAFDQSQSILTGRATRLSNSAATEIQYALGKRWTITATGAYGNLHFLDPGFVDNHFTSFQLGLNHSLTRRDFLSVSYVQNFYRLDVRSHDILGRGLQLAYGHQLRGRLSLELSGGPLLNRVNLPLGGSVTKAFWNTYDSMQYSGEKGGTALSYLRSVTGGSGALLGSETQLGQLTTGRRLARKLYGSLNIGRSQNRTLPQRGLTQGASRFSAWIAGAGVNRDLAHSASIYAHYSLQQQVGNKPLCSGANCGTVFLRHEVGIGISWHGRPRGIS